MWSGAFDMCAERPSLRHPLFTVAAQPSPLSKHRHRSSPEAHHKEPTTMNLVVLRGTLSSDPIDRLLASGSTIWTLEVTTRSTDGVFSAPVAWIDPPHPPRVATGDEVVVVGQVRRRFFRSGGLTQSRTEVVASAVVPARRAAEVRKALQRARLVLDDDTAEVVA
jgi:single-strand DNA-binding protein